MQMATSYTEIAAIPAQNLTNTKNLSPSPMALQAHGRRNSCRTNRENPCRIRLSDPVQQREFPEQCTQHCLLI